MFSVPGWQILGYQGATPVHQGPWRRRDLVESCSEERNVRSGLIHGYGIQNFLSANPFFADNAAHADQQLRDLVDAHQASLYIIMDIVLNHAADVFAYTSNLGGSDAPHRRQNERGLARCDRSCKCGSHFAEFIPNPGPDALIWPVELQQDEYFRRQGDPDPYDDTVGDFPPFKQLSTWETDVQNFLIRAYQYVIARYDIDGFRIDTLRYLKGDLPRLFGNSMREFALSIGKKNFSRLGKCSMEARRQTSPDSSAAIQPTHRMRWSE